MQVAVFDETEGILLDWQNLTEPIKVGDPIEIYGAKSTVIWVGDPNIIYRANKPIFSRPIAVKFAPRQQDETIPGR